jgi:hypothetical protein
MTTLAGLSSSTRRFSLPDRVTREGYGTALLTDSIVAGQAEPHPFEAFRIVALADEVDLALDVRPPRGIRYQLVAARERNM